MSSSPRNLRVGLRCDAGRRSGVGHAVRLLALAEELQHRGADIVHLGSLDVPWLQEAYAAHRIAQVDAPQSAAPLTALAQRLDLHAVVLDGYDLDPAAGSALRSAGLTVLAMVDGSFGAAQEADLYVDQNLGSRPRDPLPPGAIALAGIDYALFRDTVLDRRPSTAAPSAGRADAPTAAPADAPTDGRVGRGAGRGRIETPPDAPSAGRVGRGASRGRIETPPDTTGLDTARPEGLAYSTSDTATDHSTSDTATDHSTSDTAADDPTGPAGPAVLAVFGGTDPFGAAPVLAPLLLETGLPLELTVIAADPDVRAGLDTLPRHPGQVVHAVGPLTDLPAAAARADLAISASGSSVWELLCLGVPTAVVCVVDNQEPGYRETVHRGVVAGLGQLDALRADGTAATRELHALVSDPDRRHALARQGRELVDGRGRRRVADALEQVLATPSGPEER